MATLPSYIINWEEMKSSMDTDDLITLVKTIENLIGNPLFTGNRQSVGVMEAEKKVFSFTPQTRIALTSISYSQSSYHKDDTWELWIGRDRKMENIFVKNKGIVKHWENITHVEKGEEIRLYHNNHSGTSKDIFCSLGYIELEGEEDVTT